MKQLDAGLVHKNKRFTPSQTLLFCALVFLFNPEEKASAYNGSYAEGITRAAPRGMIRMCARQPQLCPELQLRGKVGESARRSGWVDKQPATAANMRLLSQVNAQVNRMIRPRPDRGDQWAVSTSFGDCEDYALTKREFLVKRGWPRSALRMAVGKTRQGVAHAVLVARTTQGDYILDNLRSSVYPFAQSPHYLSIVESSHAPGRWVSIMPKGHIVQPASKPIGSIAQRTQQARPQIRLKTRVRRAMRRARRAAMLEYR